MFKRMAFITLGVAFGLTASALAQTAPAPSSSNSGQYVNPLPEIRNGGFENRVWDQSLTNHAMAKPNKVQMARAEQAADLINANRCNDAYKLALDNGDDRLARGVRRACATPKS